MESPSRLKTKIKAAEKKLGPFHPIILKENLQADEIYALKLLQWDLAGISLEESFARSYPLKENGSHILGHIGEKSAAKKPRRGGARQRSQITGKSGLEKIYDSRLRGSDGLAFVEVDAIGRLSQGADYDFLKAEPSKGADVSLNLSLTLQEAAFKAFARNDVIGPRQGAAIAMKTNGEILAWVSSPGFDPGLFSFKMGPRSWADFLLASGKALINKGPSRSIYAPGSTIKPLYRSGGSARRADRAGHPYKLHSSLSFEGKILA